MKRYARPAIVSGLLCALFLVVYPTCNWITSLRPHVPSFRFGWERHIPFLPLFIIPYMSLDLFFIAAPFLTRSNEELRTLARRIAAAIFIAAVCFLIFPLRMSTVRPPVEGFLGAIFNPFRTLDLPFNQCPCLHIALSAIVLPVYLRHTRGWLRWLIGVWFVAIALSPLLTYQHHAIDILGGVVLALLCFHFFADEPLRQSFIPNYRVGFYYLCGALVLSAMAWFGRPWLLPLAWPAVSLGIMAAAYFAIGPGVFRKRAGRLSWTSWCLLAPVLLGHRLSLAYYARRCAAYDRLTTNVWIGRRLTAAEARRACEAGVAAVLDLTAEFSEPAAFRHVAYLQLAVLDLTAPTPAQMDIAASFIEHHATAGVVYVHCKIGFSRTAAIAGALLLASGRADTAQDVIAELRRVRRGIIIRPEAKRALESHEMRERSTSDCGFAPVRAR